MGKAISGAAAAMLFLAAGLPAAAQAVAAQQAYYAYEEAAGNTAADSSPNNLTANAIGAAVISPAGTAPVVPPGNQRSRNFTPGPPDPGSFMETANNAALTFTGPFTAAAWIRPTAYALTTTDANNWSIIVGKWDWVATPGTINGWGMQLSRTGTVFMFNGTNTGYTQPGTTAVVPLNAWTHVAAVFDGTFNRIYLNGVQSVAVASTAAPGASSSPMLVGGDGYIRDFIGNIDEVRVFNIALSAAHIGILHGGMPAPGNFTATPGPNNVSLSWDPVPGAEGYLLQVGPSATGPWTTINGATSPYTDTAATYPGTYYYQLAATGLMQSTWVTANAAPNSITPRTDSHEEGLFGEKCACGSSIAAPVAWAPGAFALLLLLAARRRSRP